MANRVFSFEEFGFDGIFEEDVNTMNPQFCDSENWEKHASFDDGLCSKYQQQEHKHQSCLKDELFRDETLISFHSPPAKTALEKSENFGQTITSNPERCFSELSKKEKQESFSLASLGLLDEYGSAKRGTHQLQQQYSTSDDAPAAKGESLELSTEEIIRIAGAKFVQSSQRMLQMTTPIVNNPFNLPFSGLSDVDAESVQLLEFLLASAEKVSNQQFERARRLLSQCEHYSSDTGNAIQRLVYYFSEALRYRIDRETGRISLKGMEKKPVYDVDTAMMSLNSAVLECYQIIPYTQAAHFAGVQAIIELVAGARKVHVIDLQIGNGVQWTVLIQALASQAQKCNVELLKISAVATASRQFVEDTGKRLMSFAESVNIPLNFKVVMVSDRLDLKEEHFELETGEAVVVYSEFLLQSFIAVQNRLDSLMRVFRNIRPRVMVLLEVEANINSPSFATRFIEALFFYSAYFDSFETSLGRHSASRTILESTFFREGIRNCVASEGEERTIRFVKLDVWRAYFARFGMKEAELSMSSLYQVRLMLTKFAVSNFCTLKMNEKSLLIGWKDTPVHSLSVWKFT